MAGEPVLTLRNLNVRFRLQDGEVHAVRNVNLDVARGEIVAVVGESGSGKSQTVMAAMGLLASNGVATGSADYRGTDLLRLSQRELNRIRGAKITMIFQEPMTSLDPLYTVGDQIAEPLMEHAGLSKQAARERAIDLLKLVQIQQPERRVDAYPHELSGGQRQRVMIAMALANDPDILIADEPTTALDKTTETQVLELVKSLRERFHTALVYVSHDLNVVSEMCDRVLVMLEGAVVGSAAIRLSGALASAIAIITRWRCPPERSCGDASTRRAGR